MARHDFRKGCSLPLGVQLAHDPDVRQQCLGYPSSLVGLRGQPVAVGGGSILPPGDPLIELGEEYLFGKVPPPPPRIGLHVVFNVLFRSLPIPPHGPENALERRFRTECLGPGDIKTESNFFNVSQARIDGPPEDEINVVACSGEHLHP